MIYKIHFSPLANEGLALLKRNEPAAYKKAVALLSELQIHPYTGTGQPEPLKGNRAGQWSRRISQKHRLVYTVEDSIIEVYILSSYGHYDDK